MQGDKMPTKAYVLYGKEGDVVVVRWSYELIRN